MVCIFPKDISLEPLATLIEALKPKIEIIQLEVDNSDKVINKIIELPEYSDILFIGHGASHCLYGAVEDENKKIFINSMNINIFKKKNIIALACRSSEFLGKKQDILNSFLGFGNIPSDWGEVLAERDFGDINYLKKINKDDLQYYVEKITSISTACLLEYINHKSLEKLFLEYRLLFNKCIYSLIIKKERKNYKGLVELFLDTKNDIVYSIKA